MTYSECRCEQCKILTMSVNGWCDRCIDCRCDMEMRWKHREEELEEMAERAGASLTELDEADEEN